MTDESDRQTTSGKPAREDLARIAALLVVCPGCDLLHRRTPLEPGEAARCRRCGSLLESRNPGAVDRMIVAAISTSLLIGLALWAPFLTLSQGGLARRISLGDTAAALSEGVFWPLGVLMVALTVAVPLVRSAAFLYVLLPLRLAGRGVPGAAQALRTAEELKPWAMAEIFTIGVAVSLVKLAGLATVTPGPAFWALGGLMLVIGFENAGQCRESLWAAVESRP